jgi:hypothetical protein
LPATPAIRYAADYPDVQAPRTASFNESDVSDKPSWINGKGPLNAEEIAQLDLIYRNRLRSLKAVDDLVEKLVNALKAAKRL